MGYVVAYNGISVNYYTGVLTHRGNTATLSRDRLLMISALAKVMPALLPADTVARSIWRNPAHAAERLRVLKAATNHELADSGINLEIREVSTIGFCLADLGEKQANKSTAAVSGDNGHNAPQDGPPHESGVLSMPMKERTDENPTLAERAAT